MKLNPLHAGQNGLATTILLLLLPLFFFQIATSQSTTPPSSSSQSDPSDPYYTNQKFSPAMGVLLIVLVSVLFLMGFFSIYIRSCAGATSSPNSIHRRIITTTGLSRRRTAGLDQSVIESFPTFGYSEVKTLRIGKEILECAVCLNEFEDDETLRLIPKCDHVFHPECIDQWLGGHTSCPVCRADLKPGVGDGVSDTDTPPPPELGRISELVAEDAVAIQIGQPQIPIPTTTTTDDGSESMDRPILRIDIPPNQGFTTTGTSGPLSSSSRRIRRTPRGKTPSSVSTSGRMRWLAIFSRSNSTGHLAVRQWEDNTERFTLRIPEEVRRQIMSRGKLNRTTSCVVELPRESSSRRGYRGGGGGSYRELGGRRTRFERNGSGRSGRWLGSLTPSFLFRSGSMMAASPRDGAGGGGGDMRLNLNRTAGVSSDRVNTGLPPV